MIKNCNYVKMVDKLDFRRPSLSKFSKDSKSYKDNYSRSYNSENVEKILNKTRSLISDFDSRSNSSNNVYATLPPRFSLNASKYRSSYIPSYQSRSASYTSKSKSPSVTRNISLSYQRSISPSPSLRSPSLTRQNSVSTNHHQDSLSSSLQADISSPRIINELCIPKQNSSISPSTSNSSIKRSSSSNLPTKLSGSNSLKYEKCYNDLLSRFNHIKMNGDALADEKRTINIPNFDRSQKPILDSRPSHYDRRDYTVDGINVEPGLTGLKNLGNTCYINSILQCLSNTPPLKQHFQDFKSQFLRSKARGKLAEEVGNLIRELWAGKYKSLMPNKFKAEVGEMKRTFRGYDQQDSHEFLTILIDSLHEDLKESEYINTEGALKDSGEKAWGEFISKNKSIISELFYGQLKSTVVCMNCDERSSTFEVFSNISLPLPNYGDFCTLRDCLDLYLKDEEIQGWHCPRCKQKREARKKLDITKLPAILVIHLKRFTSDGWCRKKQTSVDFPEYKLDMSEYTANSESRDRYYNLYAVSNHYGTMESGHYTAYCRNNQKWYKFDDSDVSGITSSRVKSPAAYILFYASSRITFS